MWLKRREPFGLFLCLSVAGLSSLVEGEGTHFSKGQAIIEADGSLFRLKKSERLAKQLASICWEPMTNSLSKLTSAAI